MNSERRRRKGLEKAPRGFNKNVKPYYDSQSVDKPDATVAGMETYETTPEQQTQVINDPNLETYDSNQEAPSLKSLETVPVGQGDENSEKNVAARFFGFIRNKFDDATDDWKQRKQIKEDAYQQFLANKPMALRENYENQYNKRLQDIMNKPTDQQRLMNTFGQVSTGLRNIGAGFGGRVSPDRVMGFKGTVLGPLPTGGNPPMQQMMQQGYYPNRNMNIQQQGYYPNKLSQPGIVGSQVPRYASRPVNAQEGSEWGRIVKIDQFGKRRSYVRRMRVPQHQQQSQMVNVTPQMQQPQTMFSNNVMGVGFEPSRLEMGAKTANFSTDNLINLVRSNKNEQGFNPDRFLH